MSKIQYTYCTIRYVHDAGAGESLNVGVVLLAPDEPFFKGRIDFDFSRLDLVFADFDGETVKRYLLAFEECVDLQHLQMTTFSFASRPQDVLSEASRIIADRGLCIQLGPLMSGVGIDMDDTLDSIFCRMVTSQRP